MAHDASLIRRFRLIWLAPLIALIAMGSWAFASPPGSSPDDDFHAASIWCAGESHTDLCEPASSPSERKISTELLRINCFAGDENKSASCLSREHARAHLVVSSRGNFVGSYPPLYYSVMSLFISDDVPTSLLIMRFVSILLFLTLTSLLYVLLPPGRRPTLVWAWLISLVPLGLFLVTSNNPSSWTIIGVGSLPLAVVGFFESTTRKRRWGLAALALVATVMAAGSRADGAVYCILVTVAVLVFVFARNRRGLFRLWLPAALVLICALFAVISAQISSGLNGFDSTQSIAVGPTPSVAPTVAPSVLGVLAYNIFNTPSLWAGVFGSWPLGWFDTKLPAVVSLGALAVYVVVCFTGLRDLSRRKIVIVIAFVAALWAIPVITLTRSLDRVGVDVQPRYLLPLIIVLAMFVLLATRAAIPVFGRVQSIILQATLVGTAVVAQYFDIRRYVTGVDVKAVDLDTGVEWWWSGLPGPMVCWIIGGLAWAALVVIMVRAVPALRPSTSTLSMRATA